MKAPDLRMLLTLKKAISISTGQLETVLAGTVNLSIQKKRRIFDLTDKIDSLVTQFIPCEEYSSFQRKGGMNNITHFIETESGKYVLRVYQTHCDIEKVMYEHAILLKLQQYKLPFGTPEPIYSVDRETVKHTEDGKPVAMFRYMEGMTPSFTTGAELKSFGWAAGKLSSALKNVTMPLRPVYRPYYEIENTHPKCPVDAVISFCESPAFPFDQFRDQLSQVARQLTMFREKSQIIKNLPHQLIHGDLNASNVLADEEGNITAILDFEFVTEDLRVMELCVCLSEIINMKQSDEKLWSNLASFLEGYSEEQKLAPEEIEVIPLLVLLRRLDVFIHFFGRYWDGIDASQILMDQIKNLAAQVDWLDKNGERLRKLVEDSCKK